MQPFQILDIQEGMLISCADLRLSQNVHPMIFPMSYRGYKSYYKIVVTLAGLQSPTVNHSVLLGVSRIAMMQWLKWYLDNGYYRDMQNNSNGIGHDGTRSLKIPINWKQMG